MFFSYSSSSITLTDIVLLKQRRIEVDEPGQEEREEKAQKAKESRLMSGTSSQTATEKRLDGAFFLQGAWDSSERLERVTQGTAPLARATELFQATEPSGLASLSSS